MLTKWWLVRKEKINLVLFFSSLPSTFFVAWCDLWLTLVFYSFKCETRTRLAFTYSSKIAARTILPWMPALPSSQTGSESSAYLESTRRRRWCTDEVKRNLFHKPRPSQTYVSLANKFVAKKTNGIAKIDQHAQQGSFFFLQNYIFQWKATPFQSKRYCNLIRNELSVKKNSALFIHTQKKNSFKFLRIPRYTLRGLGSLNYQDDLKRQEIIWLASTWICTWAQNCWL